MYVCACAVLRCADCRIQQARLADTAGSSGSDCFVLEDYWGRNHKMSSLAQPVQCNISRFPIVIETGVRLSGGHMKYNFAPLAEPTTRQS